MRSARLLVIDDEPDIGRLFQRILRKKHEVVFEEEATDALARIVAGEHFDLILCDLMMPRMSGVAFIAQVASLCPQALERIVVVTAGAANEEARAFLESTTHRVVFKPFNLRDLEAVIADVLDKQDAGAGRAAGATQPFSAQ